MSTCSIVLPQRLGACAASVRCTAVPRSLLGSSACSSKPFASPPTYAAVCPATYSPNSKSQRGKLLLRRAFEQGGNNSPKDPSVENLVEVKVDSVRVSQGASVVYLRLLDGSGLVLPVHIGENESSALLKEINKARQIRPLTHDLTKNLVAAMGYKVTRIVVTECIANTYYSRIYVAPSSNPSHEVDVDSRPSDAINLAVRFGAPMYIHKKLAETASQHPSETYSPQTETHAEIVRSVRETLASFEDPTIMYQLQKELAIKEQRYEDAQVFQQHIYHEMTHSQLLRLVVAMEAALQDGRYDEAARLRDEYKRIVAAQPSESQKKV